MTPTNIQNLSLNSSLSSEKRWDTTDLQHVIRLENEALALLDESGKMVVVRRFSKIDAHLRDLQKMVVRKIYKHHQELEAELLEPGRNAIS